MDCFVNSENNDAILDFMMQVVLAANDLPSINDVTYHELLEIISKVLKL